MTTHSAMTVSVTHAQVSIASATTSATGTAVVAITMARPPSPTNSSGSDTDAVMNSTALRRLYFKSARNSKNRGPSVPKVILLISLFFLAFPERKEDTKHYDRELFISKNLCFFCFFFFYF